MAPPPASYPIDDLPAGLPADTPPGQAPATIFAPSAAAAALTPDGDAESLREQVGRLLTSMDELHRALADERVNSSQLEQQVQEQQARLRQLTDANAQLSAAAAGDDQAAAGAAAAAQAELAEARAQAERHAAAAESLSAELGSAQAAAAAAEQRAAELEAELGAAQEGGFARIAEYKQALDEAQERLDSQAAQLEAQVGACAGCSPAGQGLCGMGGWRQFGMHGCIWKHACAAHQPCPPRCALHPPCRRASWRRRRWAASAARSSLWRCPRSWRRRAWRWRRCR